MKKASFIVLIAALSLAFTSCNQKVPECKYHSLTYDLNTATSEDGWMFDENTLVFYCHFEVPAITADVYNYGNWTINREFNHGKKNPYQVPLPLSMYAAYPVVDPVTNDTTSYFYTQHIDYIIGVGYVEVQLTNSDYSYDADKNGKFLSPEDMYFRLQLVY